MSYGYPASNSDSSPSASPSSDTSTTPALALLSISPVLAAHVACGALATLLLLPLGVLIPRYGRALSRGRWWFPLHMAVQFIGVILAVAALALGYKMGSAPGTAHPVSLAGGCGQ
jgi:protein-S-isoprenylcysteine O-methyltransferase Ste14